MFPVEGDEEERQIVVPRRRRVRGRTPRRDQARHAARAALAVNSGPLALEPGGRYEWRLTIDGEGDEDWRLAFSVRVEEEPS